MTVVCGQEGEMFIPGVLTRMSPVVFRCSKCCELTGMPWGSQSPKNIDACRPIIEARLAALKEAEING